MRDGLETDWETLFRFAHVFGPFLWSTLEYDWPVSQIAVCSCCEERTFPPWPTCYSPCGHCVVNSSDELTNNKLNSDGCIELHSFRGSENMLWPSANMIRRFWMEFWLRQTSHTRDLATSLSLTMLDFIRTQIGMLLGRHLNICFFHIIVSHHAWFSSLCQVRCERYMGPVHSRSTICLHFWIYEPFALSYTCPKLRIFENGHWIRNYAFSGFTFFIDGFNLMMFIRRFSN